MNIIPALVSWAFTIAITVKAFPDWRAPVVLTAMTATLYLLEKALLRAK